MPIDPTYALERLGGSTQWQGMMSQQPALPDFGAMPSPDVVTQANSMPSPAPAVPAVSATPEATAPAKYTPVNDAGRWLAGEIQAGNMDEQGMGLKGAQQGKLWYGPEASAYKASLPSDKKKWTQKERSQLEGRRIAEIQRMLGIGTGPEDVPPVDPAFREEYQKKRAGKAADFADEQEKEIGIQNDVITNADAFNNLLLNEGLKTGVGQDVLDTTARWLERLGVDTSFLSGANRPATADALRQQVQTNVMNVLAAQKGVQTEGDAQRARETWVRLQNTPEGNLWINQYMRNIAQRKMDRANFLLDEMERNGGNVRAAQKAWQKHAKDLPSVAPEIPQLTPKPTGEQPGRVKGTPGFNRPQQAAADDSEWEDVQ